MLRYFFHFNVNLHFKFDLYVRVVEFFLIRIAYLCLYDKTR